MPKTSSLVKGIVTIAVIIQTGRALPADVTGWRSDWTGRYPNVKPPTEWSAQKNVVWKTPTQKWGNSTPTIVGDKIFIGMEKAVLLCLSLKDGKELWRKETDYTFLMSDEEKAQAAEDMKKLAELERQVRPIGKELKQIQRKLRKDKKNEELRAKRAELKKKLDSLKTQMKPLTKYVLPKTHKVNGYSSSTPVSDGEHIFVLYGFGLATCFDLNGNRKWCVMLEKSKHNWGHSGSPLLLGDVFVAHIENCFGLDKKTGKELWRVKAGKNWGSPVPARIGDVDVLVTSNGDLIRVKDGEVIAKGLFRTTYSGPVIHEGLVYAVDQGKAFAVGLPDKAEKGAKPKKIWNKGLKKDRHYGTPLVHDGILYTINQKGVIFAFDLKSGEKIYEKKLSQLGKGTVYPSLTLAGDYILASIDSGTTLMVKPGRTCEIVGKNKLERFRTTPVFAGNRMIVRTLKNLYCIASPNP